MGQEPAVEAGRELPRGVDRDEVLHRQNGRHAGSDQRRCQPQEGVRRAACGTLAARQVDQAQRIPLTGDHVGEPPLRDLIDLSIVAGEKKHRRLALRPRAVGDDV